MYIDYISLEEIYIYLFFINFLSTYCFSQILYQIIIFYRFFIKFLMLIVKI